MEQRQSVRIPVQLRARLLHEDGRQEAMRDGRRGGYDDSNVVTSASIASQPSSNWTKSQRRSTTDHGIECGCSQAVHHGSHTHGVLAAGSGLLPLAIDGLVDDLSRTGLFLRTPQTLPPGTSAMVCLELPEEQVTLRGQVVRIERGTRTGLGLQFAGEQPNRRLVVNYLMRCHAHGG